MILNRQRWIDIIIFTVFMILSGYLSLYYGMERGSDFINYHVYNPWAFFNDRLTIDIMPAYIQSYFNPLLDIPYYLAIKYFNNHPKIITFLYGFSYALYLFVIYKFALMVFKNHNKKFYTFISVLVASGAYMAIRGIGWLSHDIFIGDLMLISLYLLIKSLGKEYHPKLLLCSGFIIGIATGFKLTAVIFAVPLYLTFIIFHRQYANSFKSFMMLFFGGALGFLITDGFWLWKLYSTFGNPFYPYFGWLFPSQDCTSTDIFTKDFYHSGQFWSLNKKIFYPLHYSYDTRWRVLYWAFIINTFLLFFVKKDKFEEYTNIDARQIDCIFTFCFFSYIFWVSIFAVPRYYSPLIGLVGIVLIVVLLKIFYVIKQILILLLKDSNIEAKKFIKIQKCVMLIIMTVVVLIYYPKYNYKEKKAIRVPVQEQLLFVEDLKIPDDQIVLTGSMTGIIVPFQNPYAEYINIRAVNSKLNLVSKDIERYIKYRIKKNEKNVYIISRRNLEEYSEKTDNTKFRVKKYKKLNKQKEKLYKKLYLTEHLQKENQPIPSDYLTQKDLKRQISKLETDIQINSMSIEFVTYMAGIDLKNIKCKTIKTNIDYENESKLPYFYICRAKIK